MPRTKLIPAAEGASRSLSSSRSLCYGLLRLLSAALILCGVLAPLPAAAQEEDAEAAATAAAPEAPGEPAGVTFAGSQVPVERVLDIVSRQAGWNVVARGKVAGQQVSLILRNAPLDEAVQKIVNQKPDWMVYKPEGQPRTIEIWDQATYKQEVLPRLVRQKVFVPVNITAEDAAKAITGILTPNIGAIAFDARSNKVIVTDQPYVLEIAQRLLEQIDVDYVTRVFYITHADVNEIAEKLTNLHSPAAPPIDVDVRTHQIIVRDRLENIRKMELLVETLDVGPDIRVYDLNAIGIEGEDAEALQEALERMITPEAFYQINIRASKLILEDIPEVHEKVEKLLAALDQPVKQVLVQAEIIETSFQEGFNYGVDYILSQDLFSSVIDGLTGIPGLPTEGGTAVGPGLATGGFPVGQGGTQPFGGVPVSARNNASIDSSDLGFLNFRDEFPLVRAGGSGIDARFLTRHAYISLQAAMSDSRTRVLQQPRLLVKNQTPAIFTVGQEIPYFTGGAVFSNVNTGVPGNIGQAGQPVQQRIQVGLTLEVTPVISNNGLVELEVLLTNDTPIFSQILFAGQTYEAVGANNQELETRLVIPSGETRVIGGLVSDRKSESRSGVPGLSKIPVVGPLLFGSVNRPASDNNRRNLLIFLTPTVVEENVRPPVAFKGRAFEEEDMAYLSIPDATITDVAIDPAPLSVELPPALPGKAPYQSGEAPLLPQDEPALLSPAPSAIPVPEAALELPAMNGPADLRPQIPEPQPLDGLDPEPEAGTRELRRIRITDRPDTTAQTLSRIPAPVGGLNLGAGLTPSGPGGLVPGAPAGVPPGAPISVAPSVPGAPPAAVPSTGNPPSAPLATPQPVSSPVVPGTTPMIPTPAAPPQTETRI